MVTGPLKSPAERVSRIPAIDSGTLYSLPIWYDADVSLYSLPIWCDADFSSVHIYSVLYQSSPPLNNTHNPHPSLLSIDRKTSAVSGRSLYGVVNSVVSGWKKPTSWYFGTKGLIKAGEYNYTFTLPNQVYGECTEQSVLDPKMIHLRLTH